MLGSSVSFFELKVGVTLYFNLQLAINFSGLAQTKRG